MKKLTSTSGETIVETLYSMLIISVCFIILAGAIVSSIRMNRSAQKQISAYNSQEITEPFSLEVYIDDSPVEGITGYRVETDNGDMYYYYEANSQK